MLCDDWSCWCFTLLYWFLNLSEFLNQTDAVHAAVPCSDTSLFALVSFRTQQVARALVVENLACALIPQASAVNAQLANDAAFLQVAVAKDNVRNGWRHDELHEDVRAPVGLGQRLEELRDGAAVDVVASALALRLEDVCLAELGIERLLARFEAGLGGVHGVDVGEGLPELGCGGGLVVDELAEDGGRGGGSGGGQYLLDLLRAGELGEDAGALDRVGPL